MGGWQGFEVVGVRRKPAAGETGLVIGLELQPLPNYAKRCGKCGEVVAVVHDVSERRVGDLSILEAETWLVFPRARLACPRCGPTVETVPWLDRDQRLTTRFANAITRLARLSGDVRG